jgi:hypothetical protein
MTKAEKELDRYINQIIDATSQCLVEKISKDASVFAKDSSYRDTEDNLRNRMLVGVAQNLEKETE